MRIPEWTEPPVIEVNGNEVPVKVDQNGFARIKRYWQEGDYVGIQFPMSSRLLTGKTTDYPNIDYIKKREESRRLAKASGINFPYGDIKYNPLLLPDAGPNKVKKEVLYNYALVMKPKILMMR